jgi:hypothetical protein
VQELGDDGTTFAGIFSYHGWIVKDSAGFVVDNVFVRLAFRIVESIGIRFVAECCKEEGEIKLG